MHDSQKHFIIKAGNPSFLESLPKFSLEVKMASNFAILCAILILPAILAYKIEVPKGSSILQMVPKDAIT